MLCAEGGGGGDGGGGGLSGDIVSLLPLFECEVVVVVEISRGQDFRGGKSLG